MTSSRIMEEIYPIGIRALTAKQSMELLFKNELKI